MRGDFDCPADGCENCEFHRTESWCAKAIPINKNVYDEKYRAYMEGFWEAIEWCEEHYRIADETLEQSDRYIVKLETVLSFCYADGRPPTAEEMAEIDNYWNGD